MIKLFGLGRRLTRENILRMYEKGHFQTEKSPAKLIELYGMKKEALSLESLQEIEKNLGTSQGHRLRSLRCTPTAGHLPKILSAARPRCRIVSG